MPSASVKNPNKTSRNRLAARAAKLRQQRRKASAAGVHKIAAADTTRGARPGLLPTSGPNAARSAKKLRKLERKMGYALSRGKAQGAGAQGEVEMKDAPEEKKGAKDADAEMAIDADIS
ncbi:hypothetical protein F5B20DRAFT_580024 [Whalleya microplaca]|nr:hypothetical protein F5B20DRAFT_580024 [Whalleya microplaca]